MYDSQFEEITLWCKSDIQLLISALPQQILSMPEIVEEVDWRSTVSHIPVTYESREHSLNSHFVGFASFLVFMTAIAMQVSLLIFFIMAIEYFTIHCGAVF